MGVLNSSLTYFLFRSILPKLRGDFYEPSYVYFKDFPICKISKSDTRYKKLVKLVDQILELNQQLPKTKTPHDKESLQRQITATDNQIDQLVYELYDLTDGEIKIVEENTV